VTLSAPTSGIFQGMSVLADRNSTATDALTMTGNGAINIG
jgi:hypothetical protein